MPYRVDYSTHYLIDSNGCWIWKGATFKDGYAAMKLGRKVIHAHRYIFVLHKGKIPDGMQLDHLCRVRNCVNPDHLEPVKAVENVHRGKLCKITQEIAEEIRKQRKEGATLICLSARFRLSQGHLLGIINNEHWRS